MWRNWARISLIGRGSGSRGRIDSVSVSVSVSSARSVAFTSGNGNSRQKRIAAMWGNGDYGRLGLGNINSHSTPAIIPSSAFSDGLTAISCGGAHTLFLTESGHVYASGLNDFGQLGVADTNVLPYATVPRQVALPKEALKISAGYHHSCAITADGELYMWGKNSNGQLGLGKRAANLLFVPTKVESLAGMVVKMAALGSEHSIAVTDEGNALSWGGGGSGRLGHGHKSSFFGFRGSSSEYIPRLIKDLEGLKVKSVAAGLLHSACVDEKGSVYTFGEKTLLRLGFGERKNARTPSMISELPCSVEVACGGYHSCAITSSGELYTWGSNENGCLGIGSTYAVPSPERVQGPFLDSIISKVSCGWKHTAVISNGKVFTWGWSGSQGTFSEDGHSSGGQLGHGDDVDHINPSMVQFYKSATALDISCGFNHTGALLAISDDQSLDLDGKAEEP